MASKLPRIPEGSWPARMPADLAAGYCGERSVDAFMKRVGTEYPLPDVNQKRRKLWLRTKLDAAIDNRPGAADDLADDL